MTDETRARVEGVTAHRSYRIDADGVHALGSDIPAEVMVTLYVNGREFVSLMCTPIDVDALALGFLLNEGVIETRGDVRLVHICKLGRCVDVWLSFSIDDRPRRQIITSGCAGGVTFDDLAQARAPLTSTLTATPAQLQRLMSALYDASTIHERAGGAHTSALCRGEDLRFVAEDVGRHNTLDKVRGLAFKAGADTRDSILVTTGRISSEMLNKAHAMGAPIVASRTSPTSLSLMMAEAWNITLVGYVRRDRLTVYTHPWRLAGLGAPAPSDNGADLEAPTDADAL